MTLDDFKRLVTPEGVKNALEPQLYMSLTGDLTQSHKPTPKHSLVASDEFDDDFELESQSRTYPTCIMTACTNAATWGYVTLLQADAIHKVYSEDEQAVIGMALVNRSIYELGRISQFDVSFHSNKKDAQNLIDAVLGRVPSMDGQSSSYYVGASVTKDEKSKSQNLNPFFKFT
ncbi:hypothetical protein [Vibrio scophthalmi]|uniref:Uncharacterized protein n=1 Tax=Vibrio scophthalmi TaxID=45658 RepID=A0A1E3WHA2_9VIBR|nr:hypothetical protein [Vibrio scophthalmi]ODS05185.1 hypothetical protein VSF3289_04326 [Vibrio scophthalmi]